MEVVYTWYRTLHYPLIGLIWPISNLNSPHRKLPFREGSASTPQLPSNRGHNAINRGTLGSVGWDQRTGIFLLYTTLLCSALLYSTTLFYPTLLYSTLLYSTLLYTYS